MIAFPLIYFICLFVFFWSKQKTWNIDLAATSLLVVISFCAIMIDINDIYDEYGINQKNLTFPTILLFCLQWTIVLIPIHLLSRIQLLRHFPIKEKMLYLFFIVMAISSLLMIISRAGDIREALVMDLADVRDEHYKDITEGGDKGSNYLMLIPNIFISNPFPTLALFFWFYMKAFMKCNVFLRAGILISSIVQAIIAIIMAGRAAMIYWAFDFFLLYSYFFQYLSKSVKRIITMTASILGGLAGFLFIAITIARFDGTQINRDPFDSLYGYAGQHINNFCTMFVHGSDSPLTFDREFPLLSKLTGHQFDLVNHYEAITSQLKANILVNVFDTFGAELYLDLGWIGYILFMLFIILLSIYIKYKWQEMSFNRVFFFVIVVAFFTRGLFAWPFVHHYTTFAIAFTLSCGYFFKYAFRI